MSEQQPRILGLGYSVPPNLRTNDDPIFDWLKSHVPQGSNPFQGYVTRVVLGPGEDLMTMMVPAALNALADARLEPSDIDMLLGYASVSPYGCPNELSHLHQMLGLPRSCYVVPLNCEFSNFNAGLLFADAMIRAGRAKNVLIVVGGNWTHHVDYHTVQSISAADGAGAAVVGLSPDATQWQVAGQNAVTDTSYFGSMFLRGQGYEQVPPVGGHETLWSDPFFQITAAGMKGFGAFGGQLATAAVTELLERHNLGPGTWSLVAHQASSVLFQMWESVLKPAQLISTIENFANMTVANIPVNLAWATANQPITQNSLVLFALGPDMHAHALLLQREITEDTNTQDDAAAGDGELEAPKP
jgi:3-oxoacyl-[acyl-carrier-protein] synthase III